ncbi:hypothetical protein Tco_0821254 [Tanacetum coccineum]|uniref:Uncharacterized protein n=1 Tax=Tanacetum coccineum TaxID=301880 RepID=A0ABQ5ABR3_9ASTR
MVLQDEEIIATVKQSFCPKFEKALKEGKCVYISIFGVGDNEGTPSIVDTYSGPILVIHLTTFSSYSVKYDFLNNLPKGYINDICDLGKAMSCVVLATVMKIERESDWCSDTICESEGLDDTYTESLYYPEYLITY